MGEDTDAPQFLTTREVAALLRVKERKVYDLAAAGEIPHRRITGKLLFPRMQIMGWIEGAQVEGGGRAAVVAGSQDPLLEWALRESDCGLASLFDGSMDGLARYIRGEAVLCGMHIAEDDGWNLATVAAHNPPGSVLLGWAVRSQGLLLDPKLDGAVSALADLAGRRVVLRQPGAGSRLLFDRLMTAEGLDLAALGAETIPARTESDAAAAVAEGRADLDFGLAVVARQHRLGFLPLAEERFDLLVDRRAYFAPALQRLFGFAADKLAERAAALGGYDLRGFGEARWLGP